MSDHTLLGHLAVKYLQPENLATEALFYILKQSPIARKSLMDFIEQFGIKGTELSLSTQERSEDGSQPDLLGTDTDGKTILIVEAKFWAGLTDRQPCSYLRQLPTGKNSALLFVAPAARLTLLWEELVGRCRDAGMSLQADVRLPIDIFSCTVGDGQVLALVSWRTLLVWLLRGHNHADATYSDILQLNGLCNRMDEDAFLPLSSEELTSTFPLRFLQFCQLVDDVADKLLQEKTVTANRINTVPGRGFYKRPFVINGFGCYLQVNCEHWKQRRSTPIWLSVSDIDATNNNSWVLHRRAKEALAHLACENPPRLYEADSHDRPRSLLIPLFLRLGCERSQVLDYLLEQLRGIITTLGEAVTHSPSSPPSQSSVESVN